MKKLMQVAAAAALAVSAWSCVGSSVEDNYKDWRETNIKWYEQQAARTENGKPYYTQVKAAWNDQVSVLVHWYNDTTANRRNLRPLYTSTVDVKYIGRLYDGTAFDSTFLATSPADSIFRTALNADIIEGWPIAIMRMRVGDSCHVVIPYNLGYGTAEVNIIKPYSALQFDIKLQDIYKYEAR